MQAAFIEWIESPGLQNQLGQTVICPLPSVVRKDSFSTAKELNAMPSCSKNRLTGRLISACQKIASPPK